MFKSSHKVFNINLLLAGKKEIILTKKNIVYYTNITLF